jgi:hypothetical protein
MKDVKLMIEISKAEAQYLRDHGIHEGITRTMRQKSKRKHVLVAEERYILELLNEYRKSQNIVLTYGTV